MVMALGLLDLPHQCTASSDCVSMASWQTIIQGMRVGQSGLTSWLRKLEQERSKVSICTQSRQTTWFENQVEMFSSISH
jgi:hypothetical protein